MQGVAIGVGIDGDGADAEALQGTDDAARDLAAIGDQHRIEHRRQLSQAGARLSRNAPTPSRASGVALSAAIRCAVPSISGASIGRPRRSADQPLRRRDRIRPALQQFVAHVFDRAIELVGDHLVHQPDPRRLGRADALAREHQPPGMARPDRGEHVRPDHRGNQAEAHLGRAEGRLRARHHDVAAGDQAGAAAERRAVDPATVGLGSSFRVCISFAKALASARFSASP